jgi:hypothetical protein
VLHIQPNTRYIEYFISSKGKRKHLQVFSSLSLLKVSLFLAGHLWLTLVILATDETEIRRITVPWQPRQIVHETLSQKRTHHKKRAGGVAQGIGSKFKTRYCPPKTLFFKVSQEPYFTKLLLCSIQKY